LNHECLWMTDGMTLAQIPWRPFQNSKLLKQSIGVSRQTLSVCPKELSERAETMDSEGKRVRERERADVWTLGPF